MKLTMMVEGRAVDIDVKEFLVKLFGEREFFIRISDEDLIRHYLFAVLNDCVVNEISRRAELGSDKLVRFRKDLGKLLGKTVDRLLKFER